MTNPYRSSLTLGATGMLCGAIWHIAERSDRTWVLSRQGQRFVQQASRQGVSGLDVDYADALEFWRVVEDNIDFAHLDLALLWVHDTGKDVLIDLIQRLTSQGVTTIHVSGSATGNPARQSKRVAQHIGTDNSKHYVPVVLGAIKTDTGQRWLTNDEISAGAIKAIETDQPQMVGLPLDKL